GCAVGVGGGGGGGSGVARGLVGAGGGVAGVAPADASLKIPHMGWNTLDQRRPHALLDGIALGPQGTHAYFVHSFHLKAAERADIVAEADYGGPPTPPLRPDPTLRPPSHPDKSPHHRP